MQNSVLEVINLSVSVEFKQQKIPLLKKINFSVNAEETLAIVGESGSGKSLTALSIMQLLPPGISIDPSSSIYFKSKDLLTFPELQMRHVRGRRIAIIFQEAITALNPVLTIGEQINEVIKFHFKLSKEEIYKKALSLLDEVGIPNPTYYYEVYPHQLSGGLKQRAMIAIALAGEPELLIADEPTTALDVTLQAQIITLLKALQKSRGMSLLFITHDLGIVYEIAQHVLVLYKGEVVESASADQFFTAPQHQYSQKLFQSLPGWLDPAKKKLAEKENELLSVENLKVYYPIKSSILKRTVGYIKAVDDISLTISAGKTLALVGESGSGKTTTGLAILRLTQITDGKVVFIGHNLAELDSYHLRMLRSEFQVVFQDPYGSMNPRMLIGNIITEGMRLQKIDIVSQEKKSR